MASFRDIACYMRQEVGEEEYGVWCLMVWNVWNAICRKLHSDGEELQLPTEIENRMQWDTYQQARLVVRSEMRLGVCCGKREWSKPRNGIYRVDVDGLHNEQEGAFGVGVIIRDWCGRTRAAMSKRTCRRANAMVAELMAVVEGIVLSVKVDTRPIMIFTDSLLVARIMADPGEGKDLLPEDICETIQLARENILISVNHMYKTANRAAHFLAQQAILLDHEMVWQESLPFDLEAIVKDDNRQ